MNRRITVCLGLLLTLCLLGNLAAMISLARSNRELGGLAEAHRIQVLRANLVSSGARIETDLMAYRLGDPHDDTRRRDSVTRFEEALDECGTCHHLPAVQARHDAVRRTFDAYVDAVDRAFSAEGTAAAPLLEREANLIAEELTHQTTEMSDQASHRVAAYSSDAAAGVRNAWLALFGTMIATLVVGGIIAFHLQRRLTRPVEALLDGIERIRQGDDAHRFSIDADEEFRALGDAFNDAYEDLKKAQAGVLQAEKMAAVGRLAAGIAHEVGNPLASISSVAQMMRRKDQSPEQAERINIIMAQIERISRIVRELLTFSRQAPETGRARVRIPELLDRALTLLSYDKRATNVRVNCDADPSMRDIRGDADKLLVVFTNIILNAFDALSDHHDAAALNITAREEGDDLVLRFEDNGPGIPASHLASLFEPFFTTKEPGTGTGLGLWICYQIIQRHDGMIRVESQPGEGTTVVIRLPCDPPPDVPTQDESSGARRKTRLSMPID